MPTLSPQKIAAIKGGEVARIALPMSFAIAVCLSMLATIAYRILTGTSQTIICVKDVVLTVVTLGFGIALLFQRFPLRRIQDAVVVFATGLNLATVVCFHLCPDVHPLAQLMLGLLAPGGILLSWTRLFFVLGVGVFTWSVGALAYASSVDEAMTQVVPMLMAVSMAIAIHAGRYRSFTEKLRGELGPGITRN